MTHFLDPDDLAERVRKLHESGGYPRGDFTGWRSLNPLYTVSPGQWTVVTGTPQSGKSEWLDALAVNLAEDAGWQFAVYSPENWPVETHLAKLAEKRTRKPFGEGPVRPMTAGECADATAWVLRHFAFLRPADGIYSPENLLITALAYRPKGVAKYGVILDPWNTLDHVRTYGETETDYVSFILTHVTRLVRDGNAHCWLVVHPAKLARLRDGTTPIPRAYDISGSAHWYNKADNIICVHRDKEDGGSAVELHVQKVRFKHIGHIGLAELHWDKVTGRYIDAPHIRDVSGKVERYA